MAKDAQHLENPPLQFSLSTAIVVMLVTALVLGINMGEFSRTVFSCNVLVFDVVVALLIRALIRKKSDSMFITFVVPWFLLVGIVLVTLVAAFFLLLGRW